MRSRFRLRCDGRPASWTETPMHAIAARGKARIVPELAVDLHCLGGEGDVDRAAAGADELAVAAPADAHLYGLCLDPVAHRAAETSAGNGHHGSPYGFSLDLPTPSAGHNETTLRGRTPKFSACLKGVRLTFFKRNRRLYGPLGNARRQGKPKRRTR